MSGGRGASDRLVMAENLAFNQTIGLAGSDPLPTSVRRYIDFYRRHRGLYVGAENAAGVAELRSYRSTTYNYAGPA